MKQDLTYQQLINSPAYRNRYDPLHSGIVNKVQSMTQAFLDAALIPENDNRSDTEMFQNINATQPQLLPALKELNLDNELIESVNTLMLDTARDKPSNLSKKSAQTLLTKLDSHPKRYSTKLADKKITSALSVLSLKLHEVLI